METRTPLHNHPRDLYIFGGLRAEELQRYKQDYSTQRDRKFCRRQTCWFSYNKMLPIRC